MKSKVNSKAFKIGAEIQWKWMGRLIDGVVKEIYFEAVVREIKGAAIKRNGSVENPAYLVQSTAGNLALKLHSELQAFKKEKSKLVQPKIFSK